MEAKSFDSGLDSTVSKLVSSPGYPRAVLKALHKSWREEEFCDITLHVGEKSVKAHKNVLASLSEYFKVLLHMDAKNKSDVVLHDVDFSSLELLLQFAYTGSVEVTGNNVQSLFIVADYLQVEFVKESCQRLLLKSVDRSNCVSMLSFAAKFYLEKIKNRCIKLIGRHLEEASRMEEFSAIPYDCVLELLSKDNLIVFRGGYPLPNDLNELAILEAAICYISGQNEETKLNGEQIYSLVVAARLIYIDYCDWEKHLENNSDILLEEKLDTVRKYLLDHKDVTNKALLMSIKNCRSPPLHWVVRRDQDNTKIIPDSKKYSGKSDCSNFSKGYFNDGTCETSNERSQISKIVIVARFNESQKENVIVGMEVFDSFWHHHGLPKDSSEVTDVCEVELEKGEVIVQVKLRTQYMMINCLEFVTNLGRRLGPFGSTEPPDVTLEPPANFSGYLHSFSGAERECWENEGIICFNVNWVCHRDIENPDFIGNWDMKWQELGEEFGEEEEVYGYISSDDYPYFFGEDSEEGESEEEELEEEEEERDTDESDESDA
ncbi:uncharacterized protein LOC110457702 [Mizuhopecten yessoensis]|uniref:uncharacterized protein LOC110457702 n=1 Tax=Mizuhopecten yessoensis TaxID=6573 RepID=UPI000B45C8AC|nr:uncharacterized protein LOC110457702 [Mizuhopecten yessoensis]